MADLPIIFSRPMVLALMSGRKTVTRRILKPGPAGTATAPRWAKGDRLYVRERARFHDGRWEYAADRPDDVELSGQGYRPSIHMPRVASRMTLLVTDVLVERIQDIGEGEAIREGAAQYSSSTELADSFDPSRKGSYREGFRELWCVLNGTESWDANPYVAAINFDVVRRNIADLQPFA